LSRRAFDAYNTPAWCVRRLFDAVRIPTAKWWLEPCAGEGAIIKATRAAGVPARWIAIEIRKECHDKLRQLSTDTAPVLVDARTAGYLKYQPDPPEAKFGAIVTNPPYGLALEFAQKAIHEADTVALLLRLPWLASVERHAWITQNMPDVYVLPQRPCFVVSVRCGAQGLLDSMVTRSRCGWSATYDPGEARPKACPECGGELSVSSTDSHDYAWFVWGKARRQGAPAEIHVLGLTSPEERKAAPLGALSH
jgi:hypothetical protein